MLMNLRRMRTVSRRLQRRAQPSPAACRWSSPSLPSTPVTLSAASDTKVDAGEYIELTNMGAEPVNISDLSLTYNGVDWTPEAFRIRGRRRLLGCGRPTWASIVLWDKFCAIRIRSGRADLAACFQCLLAGWSGVDPQLQYGVNLFTVSKGEGMANGSARTLVLTRKSTGATNTVGYDGGGAADTTLNLSYDANGVGTLSTGQLRHAPGSLVEGQKPESWPVQSDREDHHHRCQRNCRRSSMTPTPSR